MVERSRMAGAGGISNLSLEIADGGKSEFGFRGLPWASVGGLTGRGFPGEWARNRESDSLKERRGTCTLQDP